MNNNNDDNNNYVNDPYNNPDINYYKSTDKSPLENDKDRHSKSILIMMFSLMTISTIRTMIITSMLLIIMAMIMMLRLY